MGMGGFVLGCVLGASEVFFVLSFWNQRLVLPLPLSCGIPCFLWREKAEVLNDLEA
jgi:hypothetical protein